MLQEQALHAVHSIVILMDKDTCPRPEKQPGLQVRNKTPLMSLFCVFYFLLVRSDTRDDYFSFLP